MKLFILLLCTIVLQSAWSEDKPENIIDFPNVPEIPVPKNMGYDHYFKNNQPVKIVFGISDPGSQFKESLTNAAYTIKYLKPRHIKYNIQLVLYGKAVLPANSFNEQYAGYSELMNDLNQHGVEFVVCNNSLTTLNQSADDVYSYMRIVPAGILQIVKKQMQGFAYIHNSR